KCQPNLFRCLQVDHKFKLRRLLHRQISRIGSLQNLVYVNSRPPKEITEVYPVGHETALIDKLLLWVICQQPVFAGKLDDPLSFGEKAGTWLRQNCVDLSLLCGLKGAL